MIQPEDRVHEAGLIFAFSATLRVAENRGADFVKHLVPSRSARQNKALDPTALLGASGCKHPASPAMLAGQRRDYVQTNESEMPKNG
jgi:hypothetical protein